MKKVCSVSNNDGTISLAELLRVVSLGFAITACWPVMVARRSHALVVPPPEFLRLCAHAIERGDDFLGSRNFDRFPILAHGPQW
jgi:hypothetical protein